MKLRLNNPFGSTGYILPTYQRMYRNSLVYEKSRGDKFHVVVDGEELDGLAFKYYKDSKYWWIIYDVNRNTLDNPFVLTAGLILIIPDFEKLNTTQL